MLKNAKLAKPSHPKRVSMEDFFANQKAVRTADKDGNVKMGPVLLFLQRTRGKVVEAKARAA